ncbi:MAG: phosphoenolpyruvate carboxykinase, partial [Epulopiscium sp.]|nr:phosphoenolpyruvate carboxykinase [Candidatus Epulonipiscium sp.]
MLKEFSLSKGKVIINFSAKYCDNEDKILESESFKRILLSYFETVKKRNTKYYRFLIESFIHENQEDLCDQIIGLLRLLTVLKAHEVIEVKKSYIKPLENQDEFIGFIEDLY